MIGFSKEDQLGKKKKSWSATSKEQRDKIAKICKDNNLTRCMLKLPGCMGEAHAPAHRHERNWYRGKDSDLLSAPDQWVEACQSCHDFIDKKISKQKREDIFANLLNKKG